MNVRSKQKRNPKLIITIVIAVVLVAGYSVTAYAAHLWPFPDDSSSTNTQTQQQDPSEGSDPSDKNNAPSTTSNKNVDATKTSNEIPENTTLTLTITDLSQDDNNGTINYTANLDDTNQTGSCVAEFTTDGAKPVTSTTNANQGVCGSVKIPDVEFTKLGTWTLTLHYYTNNTQVVATKTIDVH